MQQRPTGLTGRILATWLLAHRTELSENGCLLWQMAKDKDGYGLVGVDGKQQRAHRFIKALIDGAPSDPKLLIDHKCRVHACVNPEHLRWVTHQQNTVENSLSIQAKNAAKKVCPKCSGPFDLLKDGTGRWCKSCNAEYHKEWFQKNKAERIAKNRLWMKQNRDRFNEYRRMWRAKRKAQHASDS